MYRTAEIENKLVKIGVGDYFLQKIKVGEIHNYSAYEKGNLEIIAKDQEIYLIRGKEIGMNDGLNNSYIGAELILDNRKISEYALLSMKNKVIK